MLMLVHPTGDEGICGTVARQDAAKNGSQRDALARGKVELQGQDETAATASLPHQAGKCFAM